MLYCFLLFLVPPFGLLARSYHWINLSNRSIDAKMNGTVRSFGSMVRCWPLVLNRWQVRLRCLSFAYMAPARSTRKLIVSIRVTFCIGHYYYGGEYSCCVRVLMRTRLSKWMRKRRRKYSESVTRPVACSSVCHHFLVSLSLSMFMRQSTAPCHDTNTHKHTHKCTRSIARSRFLCLPIPIVR